MITKPKILLSKRVAILLIAAVIFIGIGSAQEPMPYKLPSGRTIVVLAEGPMNFSQGPAALMLRYQTTLKVSNKKSLRKEVDEIWSLFKVDVEKGQFRSAIVSAVEKPTGRFVQQSSGYNFVFEKQSNGEWRCLKDAAQK